MFICLSPGGQMTTQGDARRDTLLVGTVDGISSFARSGASWRQNGHFLPGEHVSAIIFEPESRTLFAGTFGAALYASTDLGKSWERRDRGLRDVPGVEQWTFPGPPHQAHVKSLAFDPKRAETIYAAVEVGGFLKSEDGGKTWQTADGLNPDAHRVLTTAEAGKVYHVMPTTNC